MFFLINLMLLRLIMAFSFFSLPSNILSNIYEMDTTFRDKFKDQINTQIWEKSYDIFRKKLVNQNVFDDTPIIASKLDVLLQYLINERILKEKMPDQISIYTSWKNLNYGNNTISVDDTGYNSIDQGLFVNVSIDSDTVYPLLFNDHLDDNDINIFRGDIYTTEQYNDIFGDIIGRDNIGCDINYGLYGLYDGCMVFKNNEFVIVKCNGYNDDNDNYGHDNFSQSSLPNDYWIEHDDWIEHDFNDAWMYAPDSPYK